MTISDKDRKAWARQVVALKTIEMPAEAEVTGQARNSLIDRANTLRSADGRPALLNDEDSLPELGFHRLAVARGLVS